MITRYRSRLVENVASVEKILLYYSLKHPSIDEQGFKSPCNYFMMCHIWTGIGHILAHIYSILTMLSALWTNILTCPKQWVMSLLVVWDYHNWFLLNWQGFQQPIQPKIYPPLTLSQCTLDGPVYTGIPLECRRLTQCTLGYHWATQRILSGNTGIPLEKLCWNSPTLECHWRNSNFCSLHWNTTEGTVIAHTRPDT